MVRMLIAEPPIASAPSQNKLNS